MPLVSGRCIFHDKDYLQGKANNDKHKSTILNILKREVNHAIYDNEPLFCIGFQLPDFSLSDLRISKEMTKPVYFPGSQFLRYADFSGANFQEANFRGAKFEGEADITDVRFSDNSRRRGGGINVDNTIRKLE
jgi:uncharacterized protein YjbI with pentapeptide repeats